MVIGPTFTMMIPMMLGGVLAMYSYRSSGSNSGMLMYTGLITAGRICGYRSVMGLHQYAL